MHSDLRIVAFVAGILAGPAVPLAAATYHVDGQGAAARDANPGTEAEPWKTISRAGAAQELKPGDLVSIRSGVYRESVDIRVSGEPGKPIVFAAVPGARVVIKGSEILRGPWTRLADDGKGAQEPYPHAFKQDLHSRSMAIRYERIGTRFMLVTRDGLDVAGPLPDEVKRVWEPREARRVGADRTRWP